MLVATITHVPLYSLFDCEHERIRKKRMVRRGRMDCKVQVPVRLWRYRNQHRISK